MLHEALSSTKVSSSSYFPPPSWPSAAPSREENLEFRTHISHILRKPIHMAWTSVVKSHVYASTLLLSLSTALLGIRGVEWGLWFKRPPPIMTISRAGCLKCCQCHPIFMRAGCHHALTSAFLTPPLLIPYLKTLTFRICLCPSHSNQGLLYSIPYPKSQMCIFIKSKRSLIQLHHYLMQH